VLSADYQFFYWFFNKSGSASVSLTNMDFQTENTFSINTKGDLVPIFKSIALNFDDSYIQIEKAIYNWVLKQFGSIIKTVTNELINFLGIPLLDMSLTPLISNYLGNYNYLLNLNSTKFSKQ
jgi:hypothetical protein